MKKLLPLLAALPLAAWSQAPTWSDDVACIVYSHCAGCHHQGGPGHFSLTSYVDGYWWRNEIRSATQARIMPPWPPDAQYRSLAHERLLTQEEIDLIAAWVDGGAPEGDPAHAPAPPQFTDEAVISSPDLTAIMEDFAIPASTADLYRCFVLPVNNPADSWITGLEVVPGNREMVHHVLVFQDNTGQAAQLDAQDPAPGYTSFGGIGVASAKLIGMWVPGSQPMFTPPGMAIKLLANADIVIHVHYPATSTVQLDSTRVNIRLSGQSNPRNLSIDAILHHGNMTNGPLVIPANTVRTFNQQYTVPFGATITAIGPHGHLICRSLKSWAVKPGGQVVPLIDIPQWDFRWQDMYSFRRPIFLPAGTVIHSEGVYDNTASNPSNPNNPPQLVHAGEATTDEMMLFFFAWTPGTANDESIVVDDAVHAPHHLDCAPGFSVGIDAVRAVPQPVVRPTAASQELFVSGAQPGTLLLLMDAAGRVALRKAITTSEAVFGIGGVAAGAYVAELRSPQGRLTRVKVAVER